jgi:class 3 adenylate cyclase
MSLEVPETRYARSGDVSIAYQVVGEGPIDIVLVTGFVSNILYAWEQPRVVRFLEELAGFARLIRFDRRGTGLSDRPRDVPTLETRMDDVRAVMAAASSTRAALVGTFEAAPMTALFAATYPERVGALVMFSPRAKGVWAPDYPWAQTHEEWMRALEALEHGWGSDAYFDRVLRRSFSSVADDPDFRRWFSNMMLFGASPGAAMTVHRMAMDVDVRDVLPVVRVPTLVLHGRGNAEEAGYVADRIPNSQRVELGGEDFSLWLMPGVTREIERFVSSAWDEPEPPTVLATVLFTDIVDSTARTAELGDRGWAELVVAHNAVVRRCIERFGGDEVDTAGDGFFVTFDGPIRGIRCAQAILAGLEELGLGIRIGLHTGECQVADGKVRGIAVNIGARVSALADQGEVLVSSTVKDLVAGSGIAFAERGSTELKGVPGEWRLYAVER